jgi:hypothetical protein
MGARGDGERFYLPSAESIRLHVMVGPRLLGFLLACLASTPAHADSWAMPQVREVFSASRDHFVRIVPGDNLAEVVGFGGSAKGKDAVAEFYSRYPDRSYRLMHTVTLLNPVAPVDAFVSNDGRLVTVDNWHNLGYGDVLAVYGADGKLVRSYALEDLFPKAEIEAFPLSVSSRHWHKGPAYLNKDQRTLYLMVSDGRDLVLGVESGRFAYCETRQTKFVCRTGPAGKWLPYADTVPDR